jgi:predicted MFS family arabinose efflux permease
MTTTDESESLAPHWTPRREHWLLLILAVVQFTCIVDFLIIIPLEPQYTRVFGINPAQFGLIVASYGISAGISGFAAGFFLDRFDRKRALLWLYLGFTIGTLFCALAGTFVQLVAARFVAGAFGGLVGAVILAIVGDVIPMERRGAAMGLVMSSFSVASILGVPLGIEFAAAFNWHVPFAGLAALSAIILVAALYVTPPLRGHLIHLRDEHPIRRVWSVMVHPDHQKAFVFMAVLTCAGFLVFPFIAAYMSYNVGLTESQLMWIYLCGGACTMFSMNWVGRWSDRAGKLRVFRLVSLSTVVPLLLVTNLHRVPLVLAIATTTLLFICMSARMVPAMAMMTAVVEARYRGGFMSINSAVQQLAMGGAAIVSGELVGERPDHSLAHFQINGFLAIACAYSCIYLARYLKPAPENSETPAPALMEPV